MPTGVEGRSWSQFASVVNTLCTTAFTPSSGLPAKVDAPGAADPYAFGTDVHVGCFLDGELTAEAADAEGKALVRKGIRRELVAVAAAAARRTAAGGMLPTVAGLRPVVPRSGRTAPGVPARWVGRTEAVAAEVASSGVSAAATAICGPASERPNATATALARAAFFPIAMGTLRRLLRR